MFSDIIQFQTLQYRMIYDKYKISVIVNRYVYFTRKKEKKKMNFSKKNRNFF